MNHAWSSPDPGFVNTRTTFGVSEAEREEFDEDEVDVDVKSEKKVIQDVNEKGILEDAVKQIKGLEKSVSSTATGTSVDDAKTGTIEVGVEETNKEMTPPR